MRVEPRSFSLGVGLGFRTPFAPDLFAGPAQVDFLEITAEHYLDAPREKWEELELLREHFVLIPHGLNLSLGSADAPDPGHVAKLARLIDFVQPPWWSEHIAFTRVGGIEFGHLSPLPFSEEAVEVIGRNVERVRSQIDTPLILENIAYLLHLPLGDLSEAEFLAAVLERTGCGLLLDVTNLYTNAVNHGYDPEEFLDHLPPDRVVQLHFAGGTWHDGVLLDNHCRPTPQEVWRLMETVMRRFPVRGAVLEWDHELPDFQDLVVELERARTIGRESGRWA